MMKVRIAELYPYEPSAVRSCVEKYQRRIREGIALSPIQVLQLGSDWLVINGNNRVVAAVREGWIEIEAHSNPTDDPASEKDYSRVLAYRKQQEGMRGFTGVPVDDGFDARKQRILAEFEAMNGFPVSDEFIENYEAVFGDSPDDCDEPKV
jgi:hypothetical protein